MPPGLSGLSCAPQHQAELGSGSRPSRDRRLAFLLDRGGLAALPDPGSLATQRAEVVQLGAANPSAGNDLDLVDSRCVHREGPLDADAVADLADGERLAGAAALPPDHHALEDLDPGPVTFLDVNVHLESVARPETGDVGSDLRLLKLGNRGVHRCGFLNGHQRTPANALDRSVCARRGARQPHGDKPAAGQCLLVCHIFRGNRKASLS
jgi:hypothetical protein